MSVMQKPVRASLLLLRPSARLGAPQFKAKSNGWHRTFCKPSCLIRPCLPRSPAWTHPNPPHRYASSAPVQVAASVGFGIANYLYSAGLLIVLGFGYLYITDTRASIHQWVVVPTLRLLYSDPEEAHHAGVRYVKGLYNFGLHPRERGNSDQELGDLRVEVFGHVLDNPVGTSAGIDKDAEIPSALMALGPAIVEVGGVTLRPQEGNPKPRVFRIPSQNALINRYGLNSEGADHVAVQLRARVREFAHQHGLGLESESERQVLDGEAGVPPGSLVSGKLLAVQIAKNKNTPDGDIKAIAQDYVECVNRLARYADILVVNVSSPNTPGLRDLQAAAPLTAILTAVVSAAKSIDRKQKPAVMVKVSPDEDSDAQIDGICSAVWNSGVDGVIVGNTTKKRPDAIPKGFVLPATEERLLTEMGGYSGPQMFQRTLDLVKRYRVKLDQGSIEDKIKISHDTPPASDSQNNDRGEQQDPQNLKPTDADVVQQQPPGRLPERHSTKFAGPGTPKQVSSSSQDNSSKVIFATGGITNGEQCLQILNAGASVCQLYTAMMYGGVGTVTRIKQEMREQLHSQKTER